MSTKKRIQIIKLKDYGDPWINRLAIVCDQFKKMDSAAEKSATLRFLVDKYRDVLLSEGRAVM